LSLGRAQAGAGRRSPGFPAAMCRAGPSRLVPLRGPPSGVGVAGYLVVCSLEAGWQPRLGAVVIVGLVVPGGAVTPRLCCSGLATTCSFVARPPGRHLPGPPLRPTPSSQNPSRGYLSHQSLVILDDRIVRQFRDRGQNINSPVDQAKVIASF